MIDPAQDLEVYLVGGAVRDELLGLPVKDRDWVVVGATPGEMVDRGFRPVGRDFPVFLHPESGEEYALARTERKTAPGYHGFTFHSDPGVTLTDDLRRRDLTINAMARSADGELLDPQGGKDDLKAGLLRHVSDAFVEDPVRILRVARFAARFASSGFRIADNTMALMRQMVADGEVRALVAERVWQEMVSVLERPDSSRFIAVLRECGALAELLPELDRLFGVPQPPRYHPEIDTGIHTLLSLDAADRAGLEAVERFAVLMHDLGKGLTPADELPRHVGHEKRGLEPLDDICDRLRVPGSWRRLARAVCEYHLMLHRIDSLRPATILKMLEGMDAFRRPEIVSSIGLCCQADLCGRAGYEDAEYPQAGRLAHFHSVASDVDVAGVATSCRERGGANAAIGEAVRAARIRAIEAAT